METTALMAGCPPGNAATRVITGDSEGIFELINEVRHPSGRRYDLADSIANRELGDAVLDDGWVRPADRLRMDLFPSEPAQRVVPFLPRHRLLSGQEHRSILECFARLLPTGEFTSGPSVDRFEEELAGFLGAHHVVTASSGTDAMIVVLRALGIGPGDEVIMPANSFAATENAVLACGAEPVLADVGRGDYNLDPARVADRITPRTRAILPVHLYGRLADMPALAALAERHGVALVEDACQAIGVTGVGRWSHAAVLSFNPFKNFGLCGKAGAVLTRSAELARDCRIIGYHGFAPGRKNEKVAAFGYNSRMDNTLASIALALLPYLALNNFRRAHLAGLYVQALRPLAADGGIELPAFDASTSWHLFPVKIADGRDRDATRARLLADHAVETDVYYQVLTHQQQTPLTGTTFRDVHLPVTERLHRQVLHLPLHQHMSVAEQDRVVEALYAVLDAH